MIKYETPKLDIMYFDGLIKTGDITTVSGDPTRTAAQNMNDAAMGNAINAAAARTVKVQTILQLK